MKKVIILSVFLFSCFANSQVLYKNKSDNTIFKSNTGSLIFKENSSIIPDVPTCIDGIQNGDETGVDCGGSCPTSCPTGNPTISILATDSSASEANLSIGFYTITLSQSATSDITVSYSISGTATSSTDYVALSGSLVIGTGNNSGTINITPIDDALDEGNETVIVTIISATGHDLGSPVTATVTIIDDDGTGPNWLARNIATPNYTYTNPTFTSPSITTTYIPTSAADVQNIANQDKIAIISNSFDCTNCTFATGQIIRPAGGSISGSNINLSDAYIESNTSKAFASSARFSSLYDKSRVYAELFGATANDTSDDIDAIEAAILNCEFLTAQTNGEYILNRDRHAGIFSPLTRSGDLDWDLNTAKWKTTNNSTFRNTPTELTHQGYYVIALSGFDRVSIYNGEFDGQDLANRFLDLYDIDIINIDDLHIHNLLSEANSIPRAVAINVALFPNTGGFTQGFITNCLIEDVRNPGNGISNDSNGIAKAVNFSIRDNGTGDFFINNNTFRDITGDDAEGFYSRNDGAYDNALAEMYFHIKNNDLINCQRRGIKYDCSNAFIEDNLIESSATVVGNQAAMLQIFSIQAGTPAKNVLVRNNNIRILGSSQNSFFGTNDSRDIRIENNTFYADIFTVNRDINFSNPTGQQDALYDGDLSNVTFINNTITNGMINIFDKYYILSGLDEIVFENNTQTFAGSISLGAFRGAININASSLSGEMRGDDEFRIKDHIITYDLSTMSTGTWNGVISSNGTEPKNLVLDNVDITYTGSGGVGAFFGGVRSGSVVDYDSTNQIINCNITGASGTGSLKFNGTDKSVIITNSTGDGNTPITFNN